LSSIVDVVSTRHPMGTKYAPIPFSIVLRRRVILNMIPLFDIYDIVYRLSQGSLLDSITQ
jgi:hypothetical protein